jgi:hypothetical protein
MAFSSKQSKIWTDRPDFSIRYSFCVVLFIWKLMTMKVSMKGIRNWTVAGGIQKHNWRMSSSGMWRHIPEDNSLHSHRCESLKSYRSIIVSLIFMLFRIFSQSLSFYQLEQVYRHWMNLKCIILPFDIMLMVISLVVDILYVFSSRLLGRIILILPFHCHINFS